MALADILADLFPAGHAVGVTGGLIAGTAELAPGRSIQVLGLAENMAPGVEAALELAGIVLDVARRPDGTPILMLIDSASQRMSRRDELLGLNEYLGHLAKSLRLAASGGHRTVALLYGGSAAGAFIATALACDTLVALPEAHPAVMDLPSMARVTKLPLETLRAKAKSTAVFAPGLDNLVRMGAIGEVWQPGPGLNERLRRLLERPPAPDERDGLGAARQGRTLAASIAAHVAAQAKAAADDPPR